MRQVICLSLLLVTPLAMLVASYIFLRSRMGLGLQAIRDNENAARSVGVDPVKLKALVFLLTVFLLSTGNIRSSTWSATRTPTTSLARNSAWRSPSSAGTAATTVTRGTTPGPVVVQATAPGGGQLIQFVLPRGVTLETAPEPLDPRVHLRLVSVSQWAALRYSGTWSQANYDEHLALLKTTLAKEGVATQGEPVLARYNAPFTPWFMRRNEIWLALR